MPGAPALGSMGMTSASSLPPGMPKPSNKQYKLKKENFHFSDSIWEFLAVPAALRGGGYGSRSVPGRGAVA